MKSILTVTLNPAFDLHLSLDAFLPERENYAHAARTDAGGKGVNISRVLTALGVENEALLALGTENGAPFEAALRADGIRFCPFYTEGRIRENITLHPAGARETRVSLDTFSLSADAFARIGDALLAAAGSDTAIAFAGRIPRGVEKGAVVALLGSLKRAGAALYLDCNSLVAADLKAIRPTFIKPNEEEIVALYGEPVAGAEDAARAALRMVVDGYAERVMISLGERGAAFADAFGAITVRVPAVTPVSTIGAGDSTVAGMIAAAQKGLAREEALCFACACGTAACLTEGTAPPDAATVEEILSRVTVKR